MSGRTTVLNKYFSPFFPIWLLPIFLARSLFPLWSPFLPKFQLVALRIIGWLFFLVLSFGGIQKGIAWRSLQKSVGHLLAGRRGWGTVMTKVLEGGPSGTKKERAEKARIKYDHVSRKQGASMVGAKWRHGGGAEVS